MSKKHILFLIEKILSGSSSKEEEERVNSILYNSFTSEDWDEEELGDERSTQDRIADGVSEGIRKDNKLVDRKEFNEIVAPIKGKKLQSH